MDNLGNCRLAAAQLAKTLSHDRGRFAEVLVSEGDDQGVLVGEVLVQRPDGDASEFSDVVGRRRVVPVGVKKVSS